MRNFQALVRTPKTKTQPQPRSTQFIPLTQKGTGADTEILLATHPSLGLDLVDSQSSFYLILYNLILIRAGAQKILYKNC